MSELISFCMPTYNRAEFLAEAIDSCLNQSYKNIEVIIVDDGSTDSTKILLDYFVDKDSRVRYQSTENRGIAAARNLAIELSEGEYIAVMDSDDICHPDRIKDQLKELKKGFDVCYSAYVRADENGTAIDGVLPPKPKEITKESLLKDQGIPHVTITAKRECFIDYPYHDKYKVNDDYQLIIDWINAGYKMVRIKDALMSVRFHELNTSRTEWEKIKEINEEVRRGLHGTV